MKFFILALIAVAILSVFILFLPGGEKFEISPSLDEEFRLKVGEKALVRGVELVLVINKVIEDSRCPINVYCFWSGKVTVEISVAKRGRYVETVNLTMPGAEKRELDCYTIILTDVKPQREYPDRLEIPQSSYEITLKISQKTC
ncbi:MAG: hypothetical protein QXR78_06680 [Nitrososphaerota archaeon]